ncbi:MAG: tetratricopeptide repeat protein [Bacteroidia bacterium]|nr:tetratricopeptide repeat protein [Bacteroidia bacterium]NND09834.1 tetratricopeptide repeat protein [Flavobacteriaceae bacterium]NNK27066.1 tetratricopeptide repeat protein [Flavobacteriaceae bacterium]RZV70544.1 MAG: tetratricopeptide repeat protein [Flavobacteriaceae bacterium]
MNFSAFIKECHRKEVTKMLSIYVVSSWVLMQVLSVIAQPLGFSDKAVTYLIIGLLIGLPIYIFYIWKFHLKKFEGEPVDLDGDGIVDKSIFHRMYFSVLALVSMFSAVAVGFIIEINFGQKELPGFGSDNKIAVLKFGNNTGDEKFNSISKMTTDWIVHGITENQIAQVISPEVVEDYTEILQASTASMVAQNVVNDYFNPEKIISGNFYLKDSTLLFQSSITDGKLDETLISFPPIECDSKDPLVCIEELKQVILGFLTVQDKEELNLQSQSLPPKFEAFQYLIEAKSYPNDSDEFIELVNKVIEIDSNYFEPQVLRVSYYYNKFEFKTADSLVKTINLSSNNSSRQKNLLDFLEALVLGQNDRIHETGVREYNHAPFDWESNTSTMVTALQFVYKPKAVDSIFEAIPMKGMDLENCAQCGNRYLVKAWADLELKRYGKVIKLLTPFATKNDYQYLKRPLMTAYIKSGNMSAAEEILNRLQVTTEPEEWKSNFLYEAKVMLLVNNSNKANEYFDKILETEANDKTIALHANALYYKNDYLKAEPILRQALLGDPENYELMAKHAIAMSKNGKLEEANALITKMDGMRQDYQYGEIDYAAALYYAALEDENRVRRHLLKAVSDGMRYRADKFHNDPDLKEYFELESFKGILRFWH